MPVRKQAWRPGTPAWVDLGAADVDAAKAFYAGLLGWEFSESGEEFGNYATAIVAGDAVAGLGPAQDPDAPAGWMTYLATEDAAAASEQAASAGAQVIVPVMTVGSFGSMAVLVDPGGALFGLWQAGDHTGFDRYNEPGSVVWNEAMVSDYPAGMEFYGSVFGATFTDLGQPGVDYSLFEIDGRTVGGIGATGDGLSPQWRTYFSTADIDASCAKARELGGTVLEEPSDAGFGKMALIRGTNGEEFYLNEAPAGSEPEVAP